MRASSFSVFVVTLLLAAATPVHAGGAATFGDPSDDEILTTPLVGFGLVGGPLQCRDPAVDILDTTLSWNATHVEVSLRVRDLDGERSCIAGPASRVTTRWRVEVEPTSESNDILYGEDSLVLDRERDADGAASCARVLHWDGAYSACFGESSVVGDTMTWRVPTQGLAPLGENVDAGRPYSFRERLVGLWMDAQSADAGAGGARVRDTAAGGPIRLS